MLMGAGQLKSHGFIVVNSFGEVIDNEHDVECICEMVKKGDVDFPLLSYEAFCKKVKNLLPGQLPEKMKAEDVVFQKGQSVNGAYDQLYLPYGRGGVYIRMEDAYEDYKLEGNVQQITEKLVNSLKYGKQIASKTNSEDYSVNSDNLVFQLVNTEKNSEFLKQVPHRPFLDMSIIYRCVISLQDDEVQSFVVNNRIADAAALTEEQLYEIALVNTKRLFPYKTTSFTQLSLDTPDILFEVYEGFPKEKAMWITSNEREFYGASAMLYPEVLEEVAYVVGDDLWIVPSSTDEILLQGVSVREKEELKENILEANAALPPKLFLSNTLYRYNRLKNRVVEGE